MNENQELLTATEQASADAQIIELDDVEGHGLREVAAGLGAAAVLAGGATAAVASLDVHPSIPGVAAASTSVSIGDPIATSDRALDSGIATVRADRDGALRTAGQAAASARALSDDVLAGTQRTVTTFLGATDKLVAGVTTDAKNLAGSATKTAFETTSQVASTAGAKVDTTRTTATTTAGDATTTVDRKAATLLQVTTQAVSATTTNLMVTVADLNPQAGTGVTTDNPGGWVSIQVGGLTLAQVELVDGQATATIDAKDLLGKTINVVYSGDAVHASSTRSITL